MTTEETLKKAVVISLTDDVSEICRLVESLDYIVVQTFIQHRNKPDADGYIGSGKIKEIRDVIHNKEDKQNIELAVVNGKLKPSQWFTLEQQFEVTVLDRIQLILTIFDERADRKEARLQVRLAQLQYERPFVRELIHRAKAGEHPGFMASGEYKVADYYEMIKKQTQKIEDELQKIKKERGLRRQHRHESGFYLVSLAGYTNAGKSSLLNTLSAEDVAVGERMFSTLSTITRRVKNTSSSGRRLPVLITDTVGFIKDLPSWIIDAFHSTLEEMMLADVVILVVDCSEPPENVKNKMKTSMDELTEIGVETPVVVALNKTDLLSNEDINKRIRLLNKEGILENKRYVPISVKENKNITKLIDTVYDALPHLKTKKIQLPASEDTQSFISWLHDKTLVENMEYGNDISVEIKYNPKLENTIISKCQDLHGEIIS